MLNENGVIFLKYTDQIFSALNNAKLELAEHTEKKEKQVILCVSSASLLLPEIVKQIQKADPHIHLRIVKDPKDAVVFDSKIFAKDQSEKRRRNKADSDERTDPSVASKVPSTYGERNASCGGLKGGAVH